MTTPAVERPHGYTRYKHDGCRCYTCAWAVAQYRDHVEKEQRKGTWQPYVDAEPARAHVRQLMAAGIGRRRVAALADVTESCITKLVYGQRGNPPTRRIRPHVAQRILAIPAADVSKAPGMTVDATGTRRRIQALAAFGWSITQQAAEVGWTVSNLHALLSRELVQRTTAQTVEDLYDKWSMTEPPSGYARTRVLAVARKHGWFPPLAWDDDSIDDPAAFPVLVPPPAGAAPHVDELAIQHRMAGHDRPLSRDGAIELAVRLVGSGWQVRQVAEFVGLSEYAVRTARDSQDAAATR